LSPLNCEENEFDLIHAHDCLTDPSGIAAMQVSGKPLLSMYHATDFDEAAEMSIQMDTGSRTTEWCCIKIITVVI
jgi:hypothetical protein